jgi:hypothetical protein
MASAHRAGPRLSPVARASLVLGLLLLLAAGYWALEPLEVPTSQGPPFSCGTALSRPTDSFSGNVCGEINNRAALRVGTVGLAGLVVAAGGVFVAAGARRPTNSTALAGAAETR